uniref:Uncharacterized protein n=1 Tax=Anguilla anguilla TaxID=7936 RepID=A0A0E9UZ54_ANGAN
MLSSPTAKQTTRANQKYNKIKTGPHTKGRSRTHTIEPIIPY